MSKKGSAFQLRLQTEDAFNAGPGAVPTTYDFIVDTVSGGYDRDVQTTEKMAGDTQTVYGRHGRKTFPLDVEVEVAPSNAANLKTMLTPVAGVLPSYAAHVWDGSAYYAAWGVKCGGAAFRIQNDELLCRLSFVGTGRIANESTTNAIAGFTPWSLLGSNRPFKLDHLALTIGGDAAFVRSGFEFTLANNLTVGPPQSVAGYATEIVEGAQRVTARAELHQKDIALLQAVDDETEIAVSAAFTKGANSLTFALNNCLVSGIPANVRPQDIVTVNPTFTPQGATPWSITVV